MYFFRELDMQNGDKKLLIDFEDKKLELLSTFLETEVTMFSDNIIECLERVIDKKTSYEEFDGNACGIEINEYKTKIYDNLAEDGMGNWCEIDNYKLMELINMWLKKDEDYIETGIL